MRPFITAVAIIVTVLVSLDRPRAQQPPQPAQQQQQQQQPPQPAQQQQQQQQSPPPAGQPQAQPQQPPAPGTPPKPLIPLAASTLGANATPYYGEYVTVSGAVEATLSKSAFSIDQDKTKSTGQEVLVLAPILNEPVVANTYVTIIGPVVHLDQAEIAKANKDYKLDLTPDLIEKYRNRPVIVATNVINSSGLDLARRLPPPLTTEEEAFQKLMRQIGPANTALRGAIDKSDPAATKEQIAILSQAFQKTEAFWKTRGKADAIKWASDAKAMSDSIDKAVATGKWDEAKTHAGTLGQQCQSCHGAYRERFDDGSFRINKAGSR